MTRLTAILGWLCLAGPAAAQADDLLRFTNGDQLHGSFRGIQDGPQALWQRDDLPTPAAFQTTRIRQVVLHGGRPLQPLNSLSHLGLVNGDRIPGTITGIDADHITLNTACAGVLRIPRPQVAMLAPNPLGGRVYYQGPYAKDDWEMAHPLFPGGMPAAAAPAAAPAAAEAQEPSQPGRWEFSGSAWYWKTARGGTALIRATGMPDRALLRFNLAWKNRLCLALAFHADFARCQPKPETPAMDGGVRGFIPGDAADLPRLFGNSYVLQLYSNYLMLYRTAVSKEGKPLIEAVQMNNNNLRLTETGETQVEVRSNRLTGAIALFVNEEFIAQWSENDGADPAASTTFAGKGAGFGFVVQGDDSPVRISELVVAEWNGMPDSARSLQVADQDVVLMSNGTDRYAGHVGGLDPQGRVLFQGKHGAFHFPLEEVAEIRFARHDLAAAPAPPADNLVVRFTPIGSISGRPLAGDVSWLEILNPAVGPLKLSLAAAVVLDFNASKQPIDDWNADF